MKPSSNSGEPLSVKEFTEELGEELGEAPDEIRKFVGNFDIEEPWKADLLVQRYFKIAPIPTPGMSAESSGPTITLEVEKVQNVTDVGRSETDEMNIFSEGVIGGPISGAIRSAQKFSEDISLDE